MRFTFFNHAVIDNAWTEAARVVLYSAYEERCGECYEETTADLDCSVCEGRSDFLRGK